ncbi:PIN domain-containing protein [Aquabacter sp. CN5-332]|uniref:PIN domain-containing protein n=1 Tax=Aquabacter sp. CN5-332 TaxID=3156608 RepID=UPI0032B5DC15
MSLRCFVDAPILIYLQDRAEARKRAMARHSLRSIRRHGELVVSPAVLAELYGLARGRFPAVKRDAVREYLGDLMPACRSAGTNEIMDRAFRIEDRLSLSWQQCLTFAAATASDCRLLVSEDFEDGLAVERTTVINPFTTDIETVFSSLKDR